MKKLVFLFSIFLSLSVFSQNFDSIMKKNIELNCTDITPNSSFLFSHYIENNQIDSAKLILDYWKGKCGNTEPVFRANVLFNLAQGKSLDTVIDSFTIRNILIFIDRRASLKALSYSNYDYNKPYFGYLPFFSRFDQLTTQIAGEKINTFNKESIEYLFCELYADINDSIFNKLQENKYQNTSLAKEYKDVINDIKLNSNFNMSLSLGAWIPTGSMKKIGVQPIFSFGVGVDMKKMSYILNFDIKGDKSNVYYMAKREDTGLMDSTNHFSGLYCGFEVGRIIYQTKKSEIRAQLGLGFDGFDAFEDKDKNGNVNNITSIWSYNFNLGINYRFYIGDRYYIGAVAKYHIVDYRIGNIVNFSSNPISLQLTFGLSGRNSNNNGAFDRLKYKGIRR